MDRRQSIAEQDFLITESFVLLRYDRSNGFLGREKLVILITCCHVGENGRVSHVSTILSLATTAFVADRLIFVGGMWRLVALVCYTRIRSHWQWKLLLWRTIITYWHHKHVHDVAIGILRACLETLRHFICLCSRPIIVVELARYRICAWPNSSLKLYPRHLFATVLVW